MKVDVKGVRFPTSVSLTLTTKSPATSSGFVRFPIADDCALAAFKTNVFFFEARCELVMRTRGLVAS